MTVNKALRCGECKSNFTCHEGKTRCVCLEAPLTIADYEEVLKDHKRVVRQIDALLNNDQPAPQASLIDLIPQIRQAVALNALAYPALRELVDRIERCGASVELTQAVILASDLASAIGNEWNKASKEAEQRVRIELARSAR